VISSHPLVHTGNELSDINPDIFAAGAEPEPQNNFPKEPSSRSYLIILDFVLFEKPPLP
jgi:hypothetical protein